MKGIYIYVIIGQGERGEIPDGGEMAHIIYVWKQYQSYWHHTDNILVNIHTNKNQHTQGDQRRGGGEIPYGGEMSHIIIVWKQLQKHWYHTDNILVNIHTNKN